MTQLGTEGDLFKKFQEFRNSIMECQSIAEIAEVHNAIKPYIDKTPEQGGLKLDLRKILDNCFKIKEAELYGESAPVTDMNTQNISKDMQPKKETAITPTAQKTTESTGAEEVKLPPAPLEGRAKEIAEDMKDIDAENFKADIVSPSGVAQVLKPVEDKGQAELQKEVMATEVKKSRSRTKPTKESTMEHIPRTEKSVKIFRRINVAINGISFTNNEIGYEVIAGTREEALEESKALRESAIADIQELNALMKVKPVIQNTPPAVNNTPPPAPIINTRETNEASRSAVNTTVAQPTVTQPTVTVKDAQDVFGGFDLDKVMKAVAAKNPAGLEPGHEFDRYNLERLRALFSILRSTDEVAVQNPDGSGMMLGAYITQETRKFGAQFPMAK